MRCSRGHRHHRGRHGAASVLLRHDGPDAPRVLLGLRSRWVQFGRTWAPPGGALRRGEAPHDAAFREAREEVGLPTSAGIEVDGVVTDDHGRWTHTTVLARVVGHLPDLRARTFETTQVRWVPVDRVDGLDLHPGFRETWATLPAPWRG